MKIYFEITTGNIVRYNSRAATPSPEDIFFVYEASLDSISVSNKIFEYKGKTFEEICGFIQAHDVSEIVINSFRLTDVAVIRIAKDLSIPVHYVQHGLYQPYVKRQLSFFKQFRKGFYFLALFFQAYPLNLASISYPLALLGLTHRKRFMDKYLDVEKGSFWSKYWLDWHEENYWCKCKQVNLTGDPNVGQTSYVYSENSDNVLVVSQSLVEDGRQRLEDCKETFKRLFDRLQHAGKYGFVRFHPRQSEEVKKMICSMGFREAPESGSSFSLCIGSYSSILPIIARNGLPLLIVDFDKEEIPVSIASIGTKLAIEDIKFDCNYPVASSATLEYYWG